MGAVPKGVRDLGAQLRATVAEVDRAHRDLAAQPHGAVGASLLTLWGVEYDGLAALLDELPRLGEVVEPSRDDGGGAPEGAAITAAPGAAEAGVGGLAVASERGEPSAEACAGGLAADSVSRAGRAEVAGAAVGREPTGDSDGGGSATNAVTDSGAFTNGPGAGAGGSAAGAGIPTVGAASASGGGTPDRLAASRELAILSTRLGDLGREFTVVIARAERAAGRAPELREWCRAMDRQRDSLYRYRKQVLARSAHALAEHRAADAPAVTMPPKPPEPPPPAGPPRYDPRTMPDSLGNPPIVHSVYPGMPDTPDWLERPPPRVVHGTGGCHLPLLRDLAAVGVRGYSVHDVARLRPLPQAIPVYLDWLEHLDARLPGPEGRGPIASPQDHKLSIRTGLLVGLDDPSIRRNRRAVAVLTAQLRRTPPLTSHLRWTAAVALARACGPRDWDHVTALIAEQPEPNEVVAALLRYVGRQRSAKAAALAASHLTHPGTVNFAIDALGRIKAPGTRALIEPFAAATDRYTRATARKALRKLPPEQ